MTQKKSFCNKEGGCVTGRIHSLIENAKEARAVASPILVPGLLQTEEYALAMRQWTTVGFGVPYSPLVEQARIRRRMELQRTVLERPDPLSYRVLMDEILFVRRTVSNEVLHRQVEHLANIATRPNIDLRILPCRGRPGDRGGFPAPEGFLLIQGDQGVSLILEQDEATILTDVDHPERIATAEDVFARYGAVALSNDETVALLQQRAAAPPAALTDMAYIV